MKKVTLPVLLGILLFVNPFQLFAGVCWTDGTSYFVFKGGKPGVKPYAGKFVSTAFGCHGAISGSIVSNGPGTYALSMEANNSSPCQNFVVAATLDSKFNGYGTFDNMEDGSVDGALTLSTVSCDSVPTFGPVTKSPTLNGIQTAGIGNDQRNDSAANQ